MMMRALVGFLLLFLNQGQHCLSCDVPSDQQWLVKGLQTQLENWASLQIKPDPSVLIALKLAEDHNLSVITQLVKQIKETAGTEMTSGKVALYVLALRSACQNPADVSTPEKHVNLVQVLEEKTEDEIKHIDTTGTPKTTYYQLALDTLALCIEKSPELDKAAIVLAKAALTNSFQFNGRLSVDTAAVASLALFCVYEGRISSQQSKLTATIREALALITEQILQEQQTNGLLGNIYSTGLAMQALSVTSEFYSDNAWNCTKTLNEVLSKIPEGAFSTPAAASQILPSLVGKTYLDVSNVTCTSETVTVHYMVINKLKKPYFEYSTTVKVPKGSVLLAVLEAAKQCNAKEFSFQTEETSWGPMVTSINGLQGNTNEKTYWQFLSGKTPLEQGVGSYIPRDNELIVAIFSRY
ncbi:cobalamin binding intrinsic factor isoform X2 [Protobothrops mucrosquamatus]|uniref:cobalamin binding intrinsic factor isoform X2 n=1 Tax=Protobothrops mucrosquamatus TaxID=103944 RepID=UPI0007759658|nr:cobalamin binding intrinsic factor isoform X2 [Protobothrops mucrosquamatus]